MGIVSYQEVLSPSGRKVHVLEGEVIAANCAGCYEVKDRASFGNHKSKFMGVANRCKECFREYRVANHGRLLEYNRKYLEENREYYTEYQRKYRAENSEEISEKSRKNKERNAEYSRKYIAENRERLALYGRNYRMENKAYYIEYSRRRYKNKPELYALNDLRRRARKLALLDDLSAEQLTEINASFYNTCALSGEPTDLHADHVIPISIGHGGTTYGNIIPLSAELNLSKSASHLFEWFDANEERFGLKRDKFNALIEYLAEANDMSTKEYRVYTDWCFDNPCVIREESGELVFRDGPINERNNERKAISCRTKTVHN